MRLPHARIERRVGFTLIEMLVVIAIIAVLASLLTSGVVATLRKMDEVKTRHEISALANSNKQFQSDFHITLPPPSRLWLDETMTYANPPQGYTMAQVQQLGVDSQNYLRKVWPQLQFATNTANPHPIDWNSDGTPGNSNFILEGQQCLVFFLGGVRQGNNAFLGFASTINPAKGYVDPMDTSNTNKRNGPYFQFDPNRVQISGTNGYAQYTDPYGSVYAYFSSGKSANGYNAYWNVNSLNQPDCPSLTAMNYTTGLPQSIQPYCSNQTAPLQYYNPDTFQIISAGNNQNLRAGQLLGVHPGRRRHGRQWVARRHR